MKKSDFEKIIRRIVVDEIRNQLPVMLTEVFRNMMGNKVPIVETVESNNLKDIINLPSEEKPKVNEKKLKQYTKNPVLNQILNETVGDLSLRDKIGGVPISSSPVSLTEEFEKIGDNNNNTISIPASEQVSVLDVKQHLPDNIKNVLNRDFRKFMKVVDQKAGKVNSGKVSQM